MANSIADGAVDGLSRITGEFSDSALEARFRTEQHPETVRQARFIFGLGAIASVIFLFVNVVLSDTASAFDAVAPRTIAFAVSLASFFLIARLSDRHAQPLIVAWQGAITLTSSALIATQPHIGVTAVFLLPAIFYLSVPTPFRAAVVMGTLCSAVMLAAYAAKAGFPLDILRIGLALALANGLLCIMRSRSGRLLRMEWATGYSYRQALSDLAASRAMLERTFAAVPIPLIVSRVEDGLITRVNEAAEEFMGTAPDKLVGHRATEFYADPANRSAFTSALRETGSVREFATAIRTSAGILRSVQLSASGVAGESGGQSLIVTSIFDVTEQEQRERQLRTAESEYRALFENSVVGVFRSTPAGRMLRANPALVRLNGYDDEQDLIQAVEDIASEWYVEPGRRDEWMRLMREKGKVTDFVSEVYRHKTRERIWISENSWAVCDADGEPVYYEGTLIEATERIREEAQNRYLARYDELTELPNRRLLVERLEQAASWSSRHGEEFAVLCLDLDRFKAVNDAFGHAAGDLLLKEAARRLKAICRAEDTVSRMGGDEFTVLSIGFDQITDISALAARIVDAFAQPFSLDGAMAMVGTSVGIAVAPHDGTDPRELLKKADLALYRAKSDGRNLFCYYSPELDAEDARPALPARIAGGGAA